MSAPDQPDPLTTMAAELVKIREELAGLRSELLRRKVQSTRRVRTRAKVVARAAAQYELTEIELARAKKAISRSRVR